MTVTDIIEKIAELSPEDRGIITEYLLEPEAHSVIETVLSPEDLAKLDQDDEDFYQGINISPCLETDEEILSYLHQSNRE